MSKTIFTFGLLDGKPKLTVTENDDGDVVLVVRDICAQVYTTAVVTLPFQNAIEMNDAIIDHFFQQSE